MAVYTEVSDRELAGFVAGYDIGSVKSFRGMAEGIENSNYLLNTERASYVLTLFERRVTEHELPYFLGLMSHLAEQGLPCPVPIAARDGAVLRTLCARPATIVSFLHGAWPRYPTPAQCADLGAALARLHIAGKSFAMTRRNDMALATWRRLFEECRERAGEVAQDLAGEIQDVLEDMQANWPRDLPSGVIHADLFPDNVFFENGELSGMLDFYFACNDFLAYDIAVAINAWCFDEAGGSDIAKSRHLLSAYNDVRPITEAERDALPILCRGAALRFLLTRLYDRLFPTQGLLVTPKDPLEFLTRLRFHRHAVGADTYGME